MQDDDSFELDADDLEAWEAEPLSAGFEERVLDGVPSRKRGGEAEARELQTTRPWLLPLTVVATVAAAAALVLVVRPSTPSTPSTAPTVRAVASADAAYELRGARATQLAGSVRYVVPSGTPFVVSTPAADVVVGGTDFTVEMLSMNDERRKKWMGVGALALGGAAVAVYVHDGDVRVRNDHGAKAVRAGGVVVASEYASPRDEPVVERKKTVVPKSKTRRLSPTERKDVVRRLNAAAAARATSRAVDAPVRAEPEDDAATSYGTLQKDYIREVVSEDLVPILQECYSSALEDQPDLGGKLVLQFSIVGDESVGGIVEEVELSQELSTLKHPDLEECMAESATTLLFDPPEGGGRVDITYPFVFAPPDDESAEPPPQ